MSEAVRRSDAANDRRKRPRLRFFLSVRDERALHGCERALVADISRRLLLYRIGGLLLSRSMVAATGDIGAAVLKLLGIGDARFAWPWMTERRTRCQFPLGGCR